MSSVTGKIVGKRKDGDVETVVIELFDESEESIPLGTPDGLVWHPYPLANGWDDYNNHFPNDGYGSPAYAISGDLVFLTGAFYTNDVTGHMAPLPAEARPLKRQRLILNAAQAAFSADVGVDGVMKTGNNAVLSPGGVLMMNTHYRLS